ncbi:MAG TPA: hypothetical protein VI408_11700 [Gaiellaceae bacterium]
MSRHLVLAAVLGAAGTAALVFTIVHAAFPSRPPVRNDLARIVDGTPAYADGWSHLGATQRPLGTLDGLYAATAVVALSEEGRLRLTPRIRRLIAHRDLRALATAAGNAAEELPAAVYFERIVRPLELAQTSVHDGGAISASAADVARMASALMQGQIVGTASVFAMTHGLVWRHPESTPCGQAYAWHGDRASLLVSPDGKRVAVVLGNAPLERLYCAA